ncbi:MAG: efflux RND transporter periplasmic adaptor subunit [Terracidiphilus sp.]
MNESNPGPRPDAPSTPEDGIAPEQKPIAPRKALLGAVAFLLLAGVLAGGGIWKREQAEKTLARTTTALAAPTVLVAVPQPGAPLENLVLPGNVTAWTDSPIYARTNGYLTHWYYDIGARVKKGALLAVIASPEVDQQASQAASELVTAKASANLARIEAQRYSALVNTHAVSQENTDTFVNQAAATAAAVRSAEANLRHLRVLQSFEKVYAPFNGVVTAREVDTGQLINQGAGTELFHMQDLHILRVYTNVPQVDSAGIRRGEKIELTFPEHPGRIYYGTLVRTAEAIDPASRTLLVEIDVDNRAGELLPGSLAQVHFRTPPAAQSFIIPAAALIFRRKGLQVAMVVHGDIAHLVAVVIGEDDGANVQIISGLGPGDLVIQDPPDSVIEGEKVQVMNAGGHARAGGE